ncbi:MAG: T9SS type A sorting domain-containing protein [Chitinophagaceae bacterium]|nr:T9SS type A sorting domain-containing protein [Chitinophagaceae bacterium]
MKQFFTLMMIVLSMTAYSQSVTITETFPTNEFNNTGAAGLSGNYNGNLNGWSLKSTGSSIIEVDNAPGGGYTRALRFASGTGGTNNPRVDTATSPNLNLGAGSCAVSNLDFTFDWYVETGEGGNFEVELAFSGNGGTTWTSVWTNTVLPNNDEWNTVTVLGGIPNINSYWTGADFKFRLTARRSSGSTSREVWFDNFRVLATAAGSDIPSFSSIPVLVQGVALQPGAVYLYQNVVSAPETLDALVKIEVDSNAHVTLLDNNVPNADRFQPRVANDGTLGNGSETSDKGWVQFSITFIKDNSYQENMPLTDADDTYTSQSLNGLRYQHFDVDGFDNGSGYFRETGWISSPASMLVNSPSDIQDGGTITTGGYTWRTMLGETSEHTGLSSDLDVTFTATFGPVAVIRFRLGFEFVKGSGGSITADREYATVFNCLSYPQQSTLPVKLISFTGSYRNEATLLNWETNNELNFDRFEVERSSNGGTYTRIGIKPSTSTSMSSRQMYSFPDDLSAVSGNVFYYRLKMIDTDGQFKYSNVIMIKKDAKSLNGIVLNPNPVVNGMATVRFSASANNAVNFKVIDMGGKVVLQQQSKVYTGNNSISLNNLDRLQPGVYVLQVANGEEITTIKFNIGR